MTIAEQLIEQGMCRGELKNARKDVWEVLNIRFGKVPEELMKQIEDLEDIDQLNELLREAVKVKTLNEFKKVMI